MTLRPSFACNGIRWDFAYADDAPAKDLFMIWPDFYNERRESLPTDQPLPLGREIPARMIVLSDELRNSVHRLRVTEGARFYCHEGAKRVAEGRVTRITGLFAERPHGVPGQVGA
jgi:hypothetical protein